MSPSVRARRARSRSFPSSENWHSPAQASSLPHLTVTDAIFDLCIGGTEIATVDYDTAIADGDWAGWKFTSESGVLKFKQLA